MKKKFVGVSYESDNGGWIVKVSDEDNSFTLEDSDGNSYINLSVNELSGLTRLFSDILNDVSANEEILISSLGNSFVPTIVAPVMDMRFHPDPHGVMSL
jgi:hypothetical protein